MATVTPNLNLVKPSGIEGFSLATLNSNMDKIDLASVNFVSANGTLNDNDVDFRASRFIRISKGDQGIVVARVFGFLKDNYNLALPNNVSAGVVFNSAIIPANMRPSDTVGMVQGPVISGSGYGTNCHGEIRNGLLGLRSAGGAVTVNGNGTISLSWAVTYKWNGVG